MTSEQTSPTGTCENHPRILYPALNMDLFDMVPAGAGRILDVGCGTGSMGRALKDRQACEVVGVTYKLAGGRHRRRGPRPGRRRRPQ